MNLATIAHRLVLAAGTTAAFAMPLVGGAARGAAATDGGTYGALARADSVRVQYTDPGAPAIPKGELVDAASAAAQAELDSTGVSRGYATAPTPGEQVASLPLVINGLAPSGAPALPGYPFVVSSTYPVTPEQRKGEGPYSLSSVSGPSATRADAHIDQAADGGFAVGAATATSNVTGVAGGTVLGEARSAVRGASFGSLLSVAGVEGRVKITARPGVKPVVESSLSIGAVTVAGTKAKVTPNGVEPASGTLPGLERSSLDELLAVAGVRVRLLPADPIDGGVDSGALQITVDHDVPNHGPVHVAYTLGRAMGVGGASANSAVSLADNDLSSGDVTIPDSGGDVRVPELGGNTAVSGSQVYARGRPEAGSRVVPGAAVDVGGQLAALKLNGSGFYLMLIAAAVAAAVGGAQLAKAVRTPHPGSGNDGLSLGAVLGGRPRP